MNNQTVNTTEFIRSQCIDYEKITTLLKDPRKNINVKRGLRNEDGTGVMAGYTQIGNVRGYTVIDGEKMPLEGQLTYRGYDLRDLINGFWNEGRFGFEEVSYLLLFGALPNQEQYNQFLNILEENMALPEYFTEDMILKQPSKDIMNKLARCVLALYSTDPDPDSLDLENLMRQSIQLIARFPLIVAHAYHAKRHYFDNKSLYIHRPKEGLSIAENFLRAIRKDKSFTPEQAKLLDLALVVHAEHGGGNNSTFATRVLSSTNTDTYSAIAAAVGSLKGPRHGGANRQVLNQFTEISNAVSDWNNEDEIASYLEKILRKEAGDGSGLIYGLGHAIYTISDPRAVVLKEAAKNLAFSTEYEEKFALLERIEKIAPAVYADVTGSEKAMCVNVDFYSGLVYRMLDIPEDVFTPLFAIARIAGWCAHRIEEAMTGGRIIRPAYKAIAPKTVYIPIDRR